MRRIIVWTVVTLFTITPLAAEPFRANGLYASAGVVDASGCTRAGVTVTRGATDAHIFYHVIDVCSNAPFAVFLAEGWGTVPASAVTVATSLRTARITLTITGAEPTLNVQGLVGTIDLALVRTGDYSLMVNGTSRQTFATGTTITTRGKRTEYSAAASGTVFGYAMQDFGGSTIGTTQDQTIDVTK
jgi:hypothetical protein